ncbi:hypothetical protein SY83_09200 [Paenibacillus swuensis]|uniref:Glycosyl hydrolase n=1 Tax=Paenibacillus swuensis TaxID=1178515 RepID=A0A172TI14_9BACL|nr:glycoside hydrolase family 88 protein [Paenibacillus swuensis]ANE46423.1 hypothetical protein SY83_09200 [Paenibacillus swuensis]
MEARRVISRIEAGNVEIPAGKRVPKGWKARALVPHGEDIFLGWSPVQGQGPSRLRLTVAIDIREEMMIEVKLAQSGELLGHLDVRYANVFQPHELSLTEPQTDAVMKEGVSLRLVKGSVPFWFLISAEPHLVAGGELLLPHLMFEQAVQGDSLENFYATMASISSIHPFGWMEGCVLDGLLDLAETTGQESYRTAATAHLQVFLDKQERLTYENPRSEPMDDEIYGMEGTLPFAAIARLRGRHPLVEQALHFWYGTRDEEGNILDGTMLSAEGSYTVAYPMAVSAQWYGVEWRKLAVQQLTLRSRKLVQDDGLYLRLEQDGSRSFKDWARAHAWHLLGLVRTMNVLGQAQDTAVLEAELNRSLNVVMSRQREDGLWGVFLDDPGSVPDTSGSAGIAAAAAMAIAGGWYSLEDPSALIRTKESLIRYLTPDGILTGVAQGNKGGMELQTGSYRVMSQMGMGLFAQLLSALSRVEELPAGNVMR